MKKIVFPALVIGLVGCGKSSSKSNVEGPAPESKVMEVPVPVVDNSKSNEGANVTANTENSAPAPIEENTAKPVEENPVAVVIDSSKSTAISISFQAKVGGQDLRCSQKNAQDLAEGQIFNDLRFFLSNLSFVDDKGQEVRLDLTVDAESSNLQFVDASKNAISLLNFLPADCASSDATEVVKTTITGSLPHGNYKEIRFQLGLPYAAMAPELAAVPAALAPSDMGWMWQHYPADIQIEMNKGNSAKLMFNALTSSKKRVSALPLSYTLTDGSQTNVALALDLAKLFKNDAARFVSELEKACNNATKLPTEAAPNCAYAYKALGLEMSSPEAPYSQSAFSVISVAP